ncbi:hypothetical protein HQ520_00100, partial [bacterium]|nr:hypothetical protein [bacterium]
FWGRRLLVFGFLFAYIVPAALLGAESLSRHYIEPFKTNQQVRMEQVRADLNVARQDLLQFKDGFEISRPTESIQNLRDRTLGVIYSISRLAMQGLSAFLHFVLLVMFELLILPFLTALLLYLATRLTLDTRWEARLPALRPRL